MSITDANALARPIFLIALLGISSAVTGAWELMVTRVASILFFYDVAYLILAICLFALGIGAIACRCFPAWVSVKVLSASLFTSFLLVFPCLYWYEIAWYLCLFAAPFFIFGALAALVWRQVVGLRNRAWLYSTELAGAIVGILALGPGVVSYLPVNVLGQVGAGNHLKEIVASEGLLAHSHVTNHFARTDFLETNRAAVKYVFTDGMFVTRSVAWDGKATAFADPHVEKLARLKRLPFRANDAERVVLLGAGAGFDMAIALQEGAEHVTAVEVNPATIEFARRHDDWAGGVLANPRVEVVIAEARRFMQRSDESWDQINLTLLQTSTAEIRGVQHVDARVLTVEAVRTYLSRLSGGGVIAVIQNTAELASATEAVITTAMGGDDGRILRFGLVSDGQQDNPFAYLVMVAKVPFSASLVADIQDQAFQLDARGIETFDPVLTERPATDDRPFFFMLDARVSLQAILTLTFTLLIVGLLVIGQRGATSAGVISFSALLIGASAMAFQVLAVYWCHSAIGLPTLAIATALAAVLAGSGIGVALFGRWLESVLWWQTGVLAAFVVMVTILASPFVVERAIESASHYAAMMMFAYLLVLSLPLGLPFLATMQRARILQHGESVVIGYDGLGALLGASGATLIAVVLGFTPLAYGVVSGFVAFGVLAFFNSDRFGERSN